VNLYSRFTVGAYSHSVMELLSMDFILRFLIWEMTISHWLAS